MERLKPPLRMTTTALAVVLLLQLSGWSPSLSRHHLIVTVVSAQRTKSQTQRSPETRHRHRNRHRQLNANVETFLTEIAAYFLNLFAGDDDNGNRDIASTVVEEQHFYPTFGRCSCNECTDAVWNAMAGNQTCGDRIGTLQNDPALQQLFPTEYDTCIQIAAVEFPAVCGSCNPDTCDGRGPQRETAQPYYCDCPDCTEEVWRRPILDGEAQSCAAYITWAAVTMESMTDACTTIAWQYPNSECAVRCDCRPKCNCDTCTPEVLNRMAVGTNGERATCGERIAHLQSFQGGNLSPLEACQRVAGNPLEFPDICGPCNPQLCDGRVDVPSLPTVFIPTPPFPSPIVRSKPKSLPSSPPPSVNAVVPTPTPPPIAPTPPTTKASCGCHSCTANVLNRLATSRNNDGVTASCLARIVYLQENKNLSEAEACILVARDEFPGICGPCDPTRCNSDNVGVGTTESNNNDKNKTITTTRTVTIPPATMSTPPLDGLGPNVILFGPTTAPAEIQQTFDSIFHRQVNNEMGSERYSLYFLPGIYGSPSNPLQLQMGYYTEVAGLGEGPKDVILHGKIEVYNRCFAESPYALGQFIPTSRENGGICFALNNFWRSLSNLSIQIAHNMATTDDCRKQAMFWAISQASSMRRVDITGGDLSLMDFCAHTNGVDGFASGGFIADSKHRNGKIRNGSQQQFLTRNMNMEEWDGAVWNSVFVGVNGAPNDATFPDPPYTTIARTPLSREKPHLLIMLQGQQYFVDKPSTRFDSLGTSWDDPWSNTTSTRIPLDEFFIAVPGVSSLVREINTALAAGKHLLLTPGLYEIYNTIVVTRSDTVVLGLGHATIRPMNGRIAMQIGSGLEGVVVSGVTFDGGPELSPVLFQVGIPGDDRVGGNPENPITLHDIYFRIGGPYIGKATVCLEINSNYVLIDHTWVWRADHGIEPFDNNDGFEGDNERWRTNLGMVGVVVNGNNVTAMGLFVEHFQQHNLIWNGEGGQVLFFQNELPYDPPSQAAWDGNRPTLGWAGYKVDDSVNEHELWAAGVYCYNRNDPSIVTATGFEAPTYKAGVNVHRLYTTSLRGLGTIRTVLNSAVGNSVSSSNRGPEYVVAP